MAESPRLSFPYIVSSNILDALVQPVVEDVHASAPPANPAAGALYVVGASAGGNWAGKEKCLAQYIGETWAFYVPFEGLTVWDKTSQKQWYYTGSQWSETKAELHFGRTDNPHATTAAQTGAIPLNHPASAIAGFAGSGAATTVARSDHNHSGTYAPVSHGLHVPANGTGNSGKFLQATSTDGTLEWATVTTSGFKNGIINGDMRVQQRFLTASLSTTARFGLVDRFACYGAGTAVSAGTITADNAASIGVAGVALHLSGVTITGTGRVFNRYRMESNDAIRYKNQVVTFSCLVLHDKGSAINYYILINKANAANDFSAVTNIQTSSAISVASGTGTTISMTVSNMGSCENGIEIIVRADCGAVTTKNFRTTEWQLEAGTTATAFEKIPYAMALAACQRYCETGFNHQYIGGVTGNGWLTAKICYKAEKIEEPTVTIWHDYVSGTIHIFDEPDTNSTSFYADAYMDSLSVTHYGSETRSCIDFDWIVDCEL